MAMPCENDADKPGVSDPAESVAPVTITLLSGEAFEFHDLDKGATVKDLSRRLEERKPLAEGTQYQFLADGRGLDPDEQVLQQDLAAVVVKLTLLQQVVGSWRKETGDHYFIGLKIEQDGSYQCNSGQVHDGLVRIVSEDARQINLKRTIGAANDHLFEVAVDGQSMTGRCPQSGVRWRLSKEP
mmetsp:Transcript_6009/g.17198  ORF Transcript_6009/g.17198 Transcript_6009/m.17198 type:complete len:184 (+) Transcript_6009:54-605(+)